MIGVILAGGSSTRMGRDKATVEVAGRSMAEWVTEALSRVCEEVASAGRPLPGLESVPDPGLVGRGPLAGLVGAFHRFPGRALAVVAVDQPWVRVDTLARLGELAAEEAVVPVDAGVRQTTCAIYPAALVEVAERELAGEGSLQSLLDVAAFLPVLDWRAWGEDGRSWFSADTPEAVEEGLIRFGPPG